MDVDEAQVELEVTPTPDEQAQQALSVQFLPFPFTHETRNAIFARRAAMSDELVFDLLLEQASIASPQSLYPPDSLESLLQLLDAIAHCPWDALKKSCLHFYLLSHVSTDAAAKHAAVCALPPQFVHLAQACFFLDSGTPQDLTRAVTLLSDARIVQDLSPKILHTLSLAPQPDSSRLIRVYVRTAQPVLEEYDDLAIYVRALIEYNLADAWSFQRTFSETTPIRNQLIRTILDGCLIPPKSTVLPHFLALPLTSYEFSLLQSYSLTPPEEISPAAHAILQNLITVRLLHSGKYSDAIRTSRAFDTFNAKSRSSAAAPLRKASEERQQMMRDVLAVIPEVQRRQLDLELNDEGDLSASSLSASWVNANNDISMSWESLGTSMSTKAREKAIGATRSGRLEGSPAPPILGRSNVGAPSERFAPMGSAQQGKASPNASIRTPAKDTPARAPVFPQIPTPALGASLSSGKSPALAKFGFNHNQPLGFTTPSRPAPDFQSGSSSRPRLGAGLNARNAFYEPEPSRAAPSLFARQQQSTTGMSFSTPVKGKANSEDMTTPRIPSGKQLQEGDSTVDEQDISRDPEDIVMLDSDDPDSFVVRGRRKPQMHPAGQADGPNDRVDATQNGLNGATSLFARDAPPMQRSDQRLHEAERVLPGGFTAVELTESAQAPASASQNEPRRTRGRTTHAPAQPPLPAPSLRLKIPGGLFDEDAEAEEEQDHVPSLQPTPARGGRRKRASQASDTSEEDHPRTSLRRSSRLSSTGPSPEPTSPKKPEKKTATRTSRTTGAPRRKRKNMGG